MWVSSCFSGYGINKVAGVLTKKDEK